MTFDLDTPYLVVNHDLFSSILAELGWEQTNKGGKRGKTSRIFQCITWDKKWRISAKEYLHLDVEFNAKEKNTY